MRTPRKRVVRRPYLTLAQRVSGIERLLYMLAARVAVLEGDQARKQKKDPRRGGTGGEGRMSKVIG